MNLYFAIFAGLAVLGLRPGWRIFRGQFTTVVDDFERDEAIARHHEALERDHDAEVIVIDEPGVYEIRYESRPL